MNRSSVHLPQPDRAPLAAGSVPRAAFQGRRGAFSETAVRRLFPGGAIPIECREFETLFSAIREGRAEYIVAPLENTLAGAVYQCYDLLYDSGLSITDEIVLPISHCLIAVPGATLADIREVESHPVALAQCERFFVQHRRFSARWPTIRREACRPSSTPETAPAQLSPAARPPPSTAERFCWNTSKTFLTTSRDSSCCRHRPAPICPNKPITGLPGTRRQQQHHDHRADHPQYTGIAVSRAGAVLAGAIDLRSLLSRPIKGKPWQYRFFLDVAASKQQLEKHVAGPLRAMDAEIRYLGSCNSSRDLHK